MFASVAVSSQNARRRREQGRQMHRMDEPRVGRISTHQHKHTSRPMGTVEEQQLHDVRKDGAGNAVLLQYKHTRESSTQAITFQIQ